MIRFETLTLGYGNRTLIKELSGQINGGALTALVGRNGTGKSTLLRAIAGIGQPYSGKIMLAGQDLQTMSPTSLSTTISFVTTDKVRIANLRSRDVVALGRAPYTNWIGRMQALDRKIVDEALASVGMSDYADKTMDQMSDGECQRIMIARALAQQTPIILLDEPTAFLDMPNRYELCSLLSRLAHDEHKCIVFSTHELDIALELCDAVALIAPPQVHILPTDEMIQSGHIERLFSSDIISFNPATRTVKVKGR